MILENKIPKDLLEQAYWLKPPNSNDFYAVKLKINVDDSENESYVKNVLSVAFKLDSHVFDVNVNSINNGDKVFGYACFDDWILQLDIWGKYYFPEFNPEKNNQWSHKDLDYDTDYIADFSFLLKETYNITMKESGLKTY